MFGKVSMEGGTFSIYWIFGSNSDEFFEGCDVLKKSASTALGGGKAKQRSIT